MIEVREVLRRYVSGESLRAIARDTGVDRKTVTKYLEAAQPLGRHPGGPPPTEERVVAVLASALDQGPIDAHVRERKTTCANACDRFRTWRVAGVD